MWGTKAMCIEMLLDSTDSKSKLLCRLLKKKNQQKRQHIFYFQEFLHKTFTVHL